MSYKVSEKTINCSYKPFDIVENETGGIGFIKEVSVNHCQPSPFQVSYSVHGLAGIWEKTAWFVHCELKKHCNLFVELAKCTCHPFGENEKYVDRLFGETGQQNQK